MTEFPAMCPHCGGAGCDKCTDGRITVTMPEDDWYTQHCLNPYCGFDNGGCQGGSLGRRDLDQPCVMCGEIGSEWIPMCESLDDPPWMEFQAALPFAKHLIAVYNSGGKELIG